jgi:hypothetical protein
MPHLFDSDNEKFAQIIASNFSDPIEEVIEEYDLPEYVNAEYTTLAVTYVPGLGRIEITFHPDTHGNTF